MQCQTAYVDRLLDTSIDMTRGTRGAYRKEDRVALPPELQKEIVEKAAAKCGNCQELSKHLDLPKSSVHYYRVGRLTMPRSVLDKMLEIAGDDDLSERAEDRGITRDRTWANEYAVSVYREMCRDRVRLPTREELEKDDDLRRKAAAIVSYVMAEGSVWLQKQKWGECAVNITFAEHEMDLYNHFRGLCMDVFEYDIGPPQKPGNGAKAIRGFIYSRFVAEWLISNNVHPGDKAEFPMHLPDWVMGCEDAESWICSIQPWLDGEGSVTLGANNQATGFSVSQSVHTDLDFVAVPHPLSWRGASRSIAAGTLACVHVCDISVTGYIAAIFRSPALDDLAILLKRLGITSRTALTGIYLKDDGFWSANWGLILRKPTLKRLLNLDLVRQDRKVMRIIRGR